MKLWRGQLEHTLDRGSALVEFAIVLVCTVLGSFLTFRLVLDKYGGHAYQQRVMQALESIRLTTFDVTALDLTGQPGPSDLASDGLQSMSAGVAANGAVSEVCSALLRARQSSGGALVIEELESSTENRSEQCTVPILLLDLFEQSLTRDFGGSPSTVLFGPELAIVVFMIDQPELHSFYRVDSSKKSR